MLAWLKNRTYGLLYLLASTGEEVPAVDGSARSKGSIDIGNQTEFIVFCNHWTRHAHVLMIARYVLMEWAYMLLALRAPYARPKIIYARPPHAYWRNLGSVFRGDHVPTCHAATIIVVFYGIVKYICTLLSA